MPFCRVLSISRLCIILHNLDQASDDISVFIAHPLGRNKVQGAVIGALAIGTRIFSRYLQGRAIVVNDLYDRESASDHILLDFSDWQ
jgi:hypothetical protein